MTRLLLAALAITAIAACTSGSDQLPAVHRPGGVFAVAPRPRCNQDLWSAVAQSNADAVKDALQRGAKPSCGDEHLTTPLDVAVLRDAPSIVRLLLEAGADPNLRWSDRGDRHPLQEVIEVRKYGTIQIHRTEILSLLIRHGVDVNARWCPFESRGPWPDGGPSCTADTAPTPLMMAAVMDEADAVALLLAAGADTTRRDGRGHTALDMAASDETFGLILTQRKPRILTGEAGAIEEFKRRYPPPYERRASGSTVLSDAIQERQYGLLRLALGAGADPNLTSRRWGGELTPLAHAIRIKWPVAVGLLLRRGADPHGRSCPDTIRPAGDAPAPASGCAVERGMTPLMVAASTGDGELFHTLTRYGADPAARDWRGRTYIDYAREGGYEDRFASRAPTRRE